VLAAHRRISGFSGGPGWKQRLLSIERAEFIE
jgi:O6-methylguanine-DNA--protein-cysteine methyltransferase